MPLKLLKIQFEDFDIMTNHAIIYPPGDDLVGPPTPVCWPVSSQEAAHTRLYLHMAKQRSRFLGDKSAAYLKVVDDSTREIVAIARWHYYPAGYSYESGIQWETYSAVEAAAFPEEMNIGLHNFILSARDAGRQNWMVKGEPCWILMHLVTRSSRRNQGAAGLLIDWGVQLSTTHGVPVYLEAGALGRPVYEKHGFRQIGDLVTLDLRPFGVEMDFVLARMGFLRK